MIRTDIVHRKALSDTIVIGVYDVGEYSLVVIPALYVAVDGMHVDATVAGTPRQFGPSHRVIIAR